MTLNDLMEFDHIVHSDGLGNVVGFDEHGCAGGRLWAPAPHVDLDEDGQMVSLDPAEIHNLGRWTLLNGFSGQDGYSGPIMHESEYVGGGLERHIRETAGFYACVIVTGIRPTIYDPDDDIVGWAVAYMEE